jgi:hypothetical protein
LINAGTDSEEIGLLLRPRKPCYLDHWSGWLEVTHNIVYSDESRTDAKAIEKHFVWMYAAEVGGSGLWFPPGRVLVCDDKLDLAIYLNESAVLAAFEFIERENAAAVGRNMDTRLPLTAFDHVALFERAGRVLSGTVDTIVFMNHVDLLISRNHMRRLTTEYVLLPSSHTIRPLGCPVSSAFRIDATYVRADREPRIALKGKDPWVRRPFARGSQELSNPGPVFDALVLAPCNCSASDLVVC